MRHSILLLAAFALLGATTGPARAQSVVAKVTSAAGGVMTNDSFRMTNTLGEMTVGLPANVEHVHRAGFWHVVSASSSASGTAVQDPAPLPDSYRLHGNYPNPFNPSTTIPFDLPEAANVEIILYDLLGRPLERLDLGRVQAGRFTHRLDLGSHASGVYIYEIRATSGSDVVYRDAKRLVLAK